MSERLIRRLHAAFAAPADGVSDADLLGRLAAGRDDAAFELLLRRHADLVWRTCRAVCRDHHAAEDAFQATYLALARKARSIRGAVPGWLYRVAYHAALKTRRAGGVSPRVEWQSLPGRPEADAPGPPEDFAVLHDELARLPEAYRVPILLCHLHGLTQAEAAKQLGVPLGTVATRVRRGLARLQQRLTRRGVTAPAVALAVAGGSAPATLVPVTLRVGIGTVAPSPAVAALTHGALSAMTFAKLKPFAVAAVLALTAAGGVVLATGGAAPAGGPEPGRPQPEPAKAEPPKWVRQPADYAARKLTLERLKQVVVASHNYLDAHQDRFPQDIRDKDGKPLLSWRVAILPYLGNEYLYSQFKRDEPWDSEHNRKLLGFIPPTFQSAPAVQRSLPLGHTLMQRPTGKGAIHEPGVPVPILGVTDGTSNTLYAVEAGEAVPWTKPADLAYDFDKDFPVPVGPYTDALYVAIADGSTLRLSPAPDPVTLKQFVSRMGGEVYDMDKLAAPPAKAVSQADKEQEQILRQYLASRRADAALARDERFAIEAELRKRGGVPESDFSNLTLDELMALQESESQRRYLDSKEAERLMAELAKRDKAAADRLKAEFEKKWQALIQKRHAPKPVPKD
ncbi:MAG: sigma-70 family RNA polymerase sigma factor [Gemmataceae bacterium]